jgi:hypothetical protein
MRYIMSHTEAMLICSQADESGSCTAVGMIAIGSDLLLVVPPVGSVFGDGLLQHTDEHRWGSHW